jgi:putative toxin-antitoxin system antitoxin component (TIGR02293 family)
MAKIELERIEEVATVLGGKKALGVAISDADQMRRAVRRGLSFKSLEALAGLLHLQNEDEVVVVTGMAPRTLARRKVSETLTPDESDRLYRVARVAARAMDVLGSTERAKIWLKKRNEALGGEVPLQLLDTEVGAHQVEAVLGRIEHGVFS